MGAGSSFTDGLFAFPEDIVGPSIPVAIILSGHMFYNAKCPPSIHSILFLGAGNMATKLETTFPRLPCGWGSQMTHVITFGPMGVEWKCCVQLLSDQFKDKDI